MPIHGGSLPESYRDHCALCGGGFVEDTTDKIDGVRICPACADQLICAGCAVPWDRQRSKGWKWCELDEQFLCPKCAKEDAEDHPQQNAKRGPGKFDTDLDSAIYELSLDGGPDEEVGDAQDFGWYGLMRGGEFLRDLESAGIKIDRNDERFLEKQAGCIIHENSQGQVYVDWYEDEDELEADWKSIEDEAEEFYAEAEEG